MMKASGENLSSEQQQDQALSDSNDRHSESEEEIEEETLTEDAAETGLHIVFRSPIIIIRVILDSFIVLQEAI